jgi:transcriptional regulator
MYQPAHFREDRAERLEAFVAAHPLGALVVASANGLVANHIPMLLERDAHGQPVLRGHVARANELWRVIAPGTPALVIFGGAQHYVSPSWYASKRTTGEVVPTWNYAVVHAHGPIRFIEERDWLLTLVGALTDRNERERVAPWRVADAPAPYLERMLRAIVGFEIAVGRLEGKFKASQNRTAEDRAGVAAGLAADGVGAAERDELVRPP